jgi:sugar/nucleoside kinase (ribokinase family)
MDLISIGDTVVDTFVPLKDAQIKIIDGDRKLLLRYGDKIPVEPFTDMVGGNAANNAVGATRLKLKSAIYTHIGNDLYGQKIVNNFKEEKVDLRYIVKNPHLTSDNHIVLDFEGERTILNPHQPWKYTLPDLDQTRWIYLTSLFSTFVETNFIDQLCIYLERTNANLFFNPGTYQIKHGIKKNKKLLNLTKIFIVNKQEAKFILGFSDGEKVPIKKLLKSLFELGPRFIVVTDGAEGSYSYDGEKYFHLEIFPAKVVEMTGAGDGFATGTLAGLFYGNNLEEAMRWGAANGAAVVEEIGPQKGLLTYSKMQETLKMNKNIVAKEI